MLAHFNDITGANVDDGAADSLCGIDDDVIVLGHMESVKRLLILRTIKNTLVDSVGNAVVNEFGEDKAV